ARLPRPCRTIDPNHRLTSGRPGRDRAAFRFVPGWPSLTVVGPKSLDGGQRSQPAVSPLACPPASRSVYRIRDGQTTKPGGSFEPFCLSILLASARRESPSSFHSLFG